MQQYKYADDNINALENVMRAPSVTSGANKSIDWREFMSSLAYSFIRRALILGVCLGAVYYFTMFYNTQDAMGG